MDELKKTKTVYLDIEREVEIKKRSTSGQDGRILIQFPSEITEIYKTLRGKDLTNNIAFESRFKGHIDIKRGKVRVDKSVVKTLFQPTIDTIIEHTKDLISTSNFRDVSEIILVGGFADCEIVRTSIQQALTGDIRVIVPNETGLAVLKGAVLYGQNPAVVKTRLCNATYGTAQHRWFLQDSDPEDKRVMIDGQPYCKDFFNILAKAGDSFNIGETVETEVYPLKADMTKMSVHLYKATCTNPSFVTDSECSYLGKMVVDMPDKRGGMNRMVIVSLTFGDVEISCKAKDVNTGKSVSVNLDLLNSSSNC